MCCVFFFFFFFLGVGGWGGGIHVKLKILTRKMFLLTKTKRPKKVHCNIIYSRKRFFKIKTCSAERSES